MIRNLHAFELSSVLQSTEVVPKASIDNFDGEHLSWDGGLSAAQLQRLADRLPEGEGVLVYWGEDAELESVMPGIRTAPESYRALTDNVPHVLVLSGQIFMMFRPWKGPQAGTIYEVDGVRIQIIHPKDMERMIIKLLGT